MPPTRRQLTPLIAAALLAGGWSSPQDGGAPPGWVKVQQGVTDAGPLNVDFRVQPLDLRSPLGFDEVYRGQLTNQYGITSEYFARINGALTAVFPRSIYTEIGEGMRLAEVPPGTVMYIGELPPELMGQTDPSAPGLSGWPSPPENLRRPPVLTSSPDGPVELPFNAELERLAEGRRVQRAAELLHAAARAEKARVRAQAADRDAH